MSGRRRTRRGWRRLRRALLALAAAILLLWAGERALVWAFPYPLARLQAMERSTVVLAADGSWLQVWPTTAGERVLPLRWRELPRHLQDAILVAEDERFFAHAGVDLAAVARAVGQNVAAGRVVSGASTLTMQAVRIVEPRPRTLWSKAVEALRARQLERAIGKERVLDLWLTQVPMGGTLRGLEAAARCWFGRAARELDLAQAATLVAMVPAPSARAPHRHPERLRACRDALLGRMAAAGVVGGADAAAAMAQPLGAVRHPWPQRAWHLCAAELAALPQGARPDVLHTGADPALQERLERLLAARPGLPGDETAIVVLDRGDGAVRALAAARAGTAGVQDLSRCRRSVGSVLKPFLYALAMERGVLPATGRLADAPLQLGTWRPANFDGDYAGATRPADALAASANLPAVHCLERVGIGPFAELLQRLGLPVPVEGLGLDVALGTLAASPLELARAWQRFAAAQPPPGLSAGSVQWTLGALSRLSPGATALPGRLAWKSGTSSGCRDAWCVGVDDRHVLVVWLGNRSGRGEADLQGVRSAGAVLAEVAALVDG